MYQDEALKTKVLSLIPKYTNAAGIVDTGVGNSDNGTLFHAELFLCLNRLGWLTEEMKQQTKEAFLKHSDHPGLFNRRPGASDKMEAQDNIVGIIALAHELGWSDIIEAIYNRSREKVTTLPPFFLRNNFNNTNPGKFDIRAWLGRFPDVICQIHFAANKRPSFFLRFYFILSLLSSQFRSTGFGGGANDYWTLTWLMAATAKGKCWFVDRAIRVFEINVKRRGGMGVIISNYFKSFKHPTTLVWGLVDL